MNIFMTDSSPVLAAQALDNKRLNKMILETAQILSNAVRHYFPDPDSFTQAAFGFDKLYKPTHVNHPSCKYARHSPETYAWTLQHFEALANEKYARDSVVPNKQPVMHLSYSKLHALFVSIANDIIEDYRHIDLDYCTMVMKNYIAISDDSIRTKFDNPVDVYRYYMVSKWIADPVTLSSWGSRGAPEWLPEWIDLA